MARRAALRNPTTRTAPRAASRVNTQGSAQTCGADGHKSGHNKPETAEVANQRHRTLTLATTNADGETADKALANIVVEGVMMNAVAMHAFIAPQGLPNLDATECLASLQHAADAVSKNGDLRQLEGMLTAQTVALNAIFVNFAMRGAKAAGQDYMERCMRLALRAQNQSRATVETLAVVKNPNTPIFAKQANIAHGPQQVNNMMTAPAADASRASDGSPRESRVLEAHGERVDA